MGADHLDRLKRFRIPLLGTRGVWAQLEASWQKIGSDHAYPAPVQSLLGQAVAVTTLLAGNLKSPGRLSLQLKSSGGMRTLFAECDFEGHVRGIARLADHFAPEHDVDLTQLPDAVLGITLERPQHERYQGLIAVEHATLAEVLEGYFAQSEQLPTRVWLAANASRCAGLLLQQVAGGAEPVDSGFVEASLLASTLKHQELLQLPPETLLHRLFSEHDKHLELGIPVEFGCSCSRERVGKMFESLGRDEAFASLQGDQAEVRCEFCNRLWVFDRIDMTRLFLAPGSTDPADPTAH